MPSTLRGRLARHLGRLQQNLDAVGEQVREAVANAVGRTVAEAIGEAVYEALCPRPDAARSFAAGFPYPGHTRHRGLERAGLGSRCWAFRLAGGLRLRRLRRCTVRRRSRAAGDGVWAGGAASWALGPCRGGGSASGGLVAAAASRSGLAPGRLGRRRRRRTRGPRRSMPAASPAW